MGFDQDSFRARNDDGSETAATWIAAANSNWPQFVDQTFRLRFLVQEVSGAVGVSGFEWQCRLNTGSWESVHTDTPWDLGSVGVTPITSIMSGKGTSNVQEVTFSSDGTKIYTIGADTDSVHQYTLSTAWDVTSAGDADAYFEVGNGETVPTAVTFSADGTKMYVVGWTNDTVYQYPLSSAWDLTTAGASNASKLVSGEATQPAGIALSSDGTKMYVVDRNTATVYQYPLSIAWDLSSAGATNASKLVSGEESLPASVLLSSDGTKMYIVGTANDTVYQYPLSTAWDLSSAGATNASKLVSGEDGSPNGVTFSADGTKMYIAGELTDAIYRYPLSTAWDLSSAGVTNQNMSTYSDVATPVGMVFSSDGTKIYIADRVSNKVHQYPLSTAWSLLSKGSVTATLDISSEETDVSDIVLSTDGTKLFVVGRSNKTVFRYPLSTAWDLSSAGINDVSTSASADEADPLGLAFSSDGTKLYIVGRIDDTVYQYPLSTAWDVSSRGATNASKLISGEDTYPRTMTFSSDGTKMYVSGDTNDSGFQYPLSTAWNLTSAGAVEKTVDLSRDIASLSSIAFNSDGTKMYTTDRSGTPLSLREYSLIPLVKPVNSANVVDATDTTQQLGAGTFVTPNAGITEDGVNEATASFAGNDESEFEAVLQLNSTRVSVSDTVQLRLVAIDGALLDSYTNTPTITADSATKIINIPTGVLSLVGYAPNVLTSASIIIDIPVGALSLAGYAPIISLPVVADIPAGSVTLTGLVPTIIVPTGTLVDIPTGSLTLTGLAPTIKLAITVEVPTASLTLTGFAPTVPQAIVVDVPVAQLTLTGFAPIIPAAVLVDVPTGSLSLTGFAPVVTTSVIVDIPVGALTLTGLAPVVKTDVLIDIPVGSLDLTGLVPIVKVNTIITVPTGALTLTGLAPVIGVGTVVVIPVASLDLTGLAPLVATSANIAIPVGTLLLAGQVPFVVIAPVVQPGDVAANTIVRVQSESRLTIVQAGVRTVVTPAELRVVKY